VNSLRIALNSLPSTTFLQWLRHWRYTWAIVPVLIVSVLSINNHLYYNIFYGYDMPQHFLNAHIIRTTGGTVTPETNFPNGYEASQAPLFYIFSAWILVIGDPIVGDSMRGLMPVILLLISFIWLGIMVNLVERFLKRLNPLVKAITFTLMMLFPMHVMIRVMYSNDFPVLIFGMLAIMSMWRMVRTRREYELGAWLRSAALIGFAIMFKLNGIILMATYLGLAYFIAFHDVWRRGNAVWKVLIYSLVGLPLMVIPFVVNNYHNARFSDDPMGVYGVQERYVDMSIQLKFLTSFDFTLFQSPFAYLHGHRGYWSLEYVTLHSDYYNHWNSDAYLDSSYNNLLTSMAHRFPMPISRYTDLQLLQFLAVPVTFVMVFAFVYALYRCIFRWRYAVRDGSALVVMFTVACHSAQMIRYLRYPDVFAVIIHARFLSFLWLFLFIVGIYWLAKLGSHRGWFGTIASGMLVLFGAYCFIAFRAMWLPPI
jgi:hypothetical protein